jgi:hypothetical protein
VEGPFDVVVASGALEYVEDLGGVLRKMRSVVGEGALVVATHVNLAHVSRFPRHPDWRSQARPDDFVLALWEAGLAPTWIGASSAGYTPAPAVDAEGPTDHDLDGGGQLGMERLVRLAHHLVVACRAGEARPGPGAMGQLADAGEFLDAARIGLELVRRFPWAARAWADLGVVMHLGGRVEDGARYLGRALQLDPARPDAVENAAAIGLVWEPLSSESRAIVTGDWRTVALELAAAGRPHAALRGQTLTVNHFNGPTPTSTG